MRFCYWILVPFITQISSGVPIESIHAKYATPIAPREGVLMVPLLSEVPSDNWPTTLSITLEDGQEIVGQIGWIEFNQHQGVAWSESPVTIRPIAPTDDTSQIHSNDTTTGPVLLAQLTACNDGKITIGHNTIDPIWFNLPDELPMLNLEPVDSSITLEVGNRYNTSLRNPLEYWRATLVASRKGVLPFEIPHHDNEVLMLAAKQGKQIWKIAFDRLARSSRGVAAECRDLLTNTGIDGETEFACWSTGNESQLLSTLLDKSLSSRQLATRALRWCEEQQPFVYWLEQVYGDEVIIAVTNPTLEEMLLAMKWRDGNDIPLAIEIAPKETLRIPVQRVEKMDLSIFGPTTTQSRVEWLDVQIDSQVFSIPIVPHCVVALPPSVQLQPLYPRRTLQSLHRHTPNIVPIEMRTLVQLRKLFGKWEFFVTCNGLAKNTHAGGEQVLIYHHVTQSKLQLVPSEHTTTENGWTAAVDVPPDWIVDGKLSFSVVRCHDNVQYSESAPLPCVPWNLDFPLPIVVDVSQWDLINQFPHSR